ncbi:MAG: esterase family protein [Candidatus Riflebacteria bacterium]|nr:esterase family protein [Candidatus Riflebacteria bacterium]
MKASVQNGICQIKLIVKLKAEMPKSDCLYVSGNLLELGDWNPAGKKMQQSVDGSYYIEFNARLNSIIQCKFTRGTWKTQAIIDKDDVPPNNLVIKANKSKEVKVDILEFLDQRPIVSDPVQGKLLSFDNFECKDLDYKRPITVWLPDSYSEKSEPNAVIYMHDGQNLFEPSASFAGNDWKVDETLTKMLKAKKIKACIVVAIPNSPDRMKELNLESKHGKAYAEFVINEVMPFVNGKFNTSKKPEDNIVAGSSMGGLMSFQMAIEYPDIFGKAACFSPAFPLTFSQTMGKVSKSKSLPLQSMIYLDTGEYEDQITRSYYEMMELLQKKGYIEGKNLFGYFDKKATHTESAWANRFHIPMQYFLGNKK